MRLRQKRSQVAARAGRKLAGGLAPFERVQRYKPPLDYILPVEDARRNTLPENLKVTDLQNVLLRRRARGDVR